MAPFDIGASLVRDAVTHSSVSQNVNKRGNSGIADLRQGLNIFLVNYTSHTSTLAMFHHSLTLLPSSVFFFKIRLK